MGRELINNPLLMLKLSAATVSLSTSTAKLQAYQLSLITDLKKDYDHYNYLKQSYIDSYEEDEQWADELSGISAEIDDMLLGMKTDNE